MKPTWCVINGELDSLSGHDAARVKTLKVCFVVAGLEFSRPKPVDEGRLADLGVADHDHGGVVSGAHPHDDVSAHCVSVFLSGHPLQDWAPDSDQ